MKPKKTLSLHDIFHTSASVDFGSEDHPVIVDQQGEHLPFDEIIRKAEKPEYAEWEPLPSQHETTQIPLRKSTH